MPFTLLSFAFESQLTSAKMGQMQDNLTSFTLGLFGAPTVNSISAIATDSLLGEHLSFEEEDIGTINLPTSSITTLSLAGLYMLHLATATGTIHFEGFINGAWRTISGAADVSTPILFTETNKWRVRNVSSTIAVDLHWIKL